VRTAARDDALAGCVAIAPAVKPKPEVSVGLPPAREVELDVPVLLVCAANDELVACDDCSGWAEEASADKVVVGGANHFFWGKYKTLGATVGGWLDTIV
jgi:alpha/beta superfamily hydrolase